MVSCMTDGCSFCIIRVLDKFYVGDLVDNEMPVFPEPG